MAMINESLWIIYEIQGKITFIYNVSNNLLIKPPEDSISRSSFHSFSIAEHIEPYKVNHIDIGSGCCSNKTEAQEEHCILFLHSTERLPYIL